MDEPWTDPTCRHVGPTHVCHRRDGRPIRPGEPCYSETADQMRGEIRVTDPDDIDTIIDAKRERTSR